MYAPYSQPACMPLHCRNTSQNKISACVKDHHRFYDLLTWDKKIHRMNIALEQETKTDENFLKQKFTALHLNGSTYTTLTSFNNVNLQ